jgi:hypothetical protein
VVHIDNELEDARGVFAGKEYGEKGYYGEHQKG